jgi:hypothetical protein
MNMKFRSLGLAMGLAVAILFAASAKAVPVTVNLNSVIDIQSYNVGENATDPVYVLVIGTAAGKAIHERLPKEGSWTAGPKLRPIDSKSPVTLWKGDLDNGQFVVLTVAMFQGKGEDTAAAKQFIESLKEAEQKVPELSSAALKPDEIKKLAEAKLKADKSVIKNIKKEFSREKKTDHYGGLFTLIVVNDNGKLVKRVDPVGLTFGEHNGNDIKIYSKLKNTRNNVLMKDEKGQWGEEQLEPVSDDSNGLRIKELENELIKQADDKPLPHTTDYVLEISVLNGDKPQPWTAEGEQPGVDDIHKFWLYAD